MLSIIQQVRDMNDQPWSRFSPPQTIDYWYLRTDFMDYWTVRRIFHDERFSFSFEFFFRFSSR